MAPAAIQHDRVTVLLWYAARCTLPPPLAVTCRSPWTPARHSPAGMEVSGTLPAIKLLAQQLSDVSVDGGQFKLEGLPAFDRVWVQVRAIQAA